jgi:hypothetical protein
LTFDHLRLTTAFLRGTRGELLVVRFYRERLVRSAAIMPPSRRRRFLKRGDLVEKREEDKKVIARYGLQPLDDRPDLAPSTAERREALMREWIE